MGYPREFFPGGGPVVQKIGHDEWCLAETFRYRIAGSADNEIAVPAGFICDGASIPWGLYNLMRPEGDLFPAGVVHDYLYRRKTPAGYVPPTRQEAERLQAEGVELGHFIRTGEPITRAEADGILYHVGIDSGAAWWQCRAAWIGVRIGGWASW